MKSAPGPTRTGDLRIRNPLLYPPELQGRLNHFNDLAILLIIFVSGFATILPLL